MIDYMVVWLGLVLIVVYEFDVFVYVVGLVVRGYGYLILLFLVIFDELVVGKVLIVWIGSGVFCCMFSLV